MMMHQPGQTDFTTVLPMSARHSIASSSDRHLIGTNLNPPH